MAVLATKYALSEEAEQLSPEQQLFAAAIEAHINDLSSKKPWQRRNALRFINSSTLDLFCDLIGWEASTVRGKLKRAGKLNY